MNNPMRFLSNPDRTGRRPVPQHDLSGARPRGAEEVPMSFRSMFQRACLTLGLVALAATSAVAAAPKLDKRVIPVGSEQGVTVSGETVRLTSSAVVNFEELARMEKLGFGVKVPDRQRHMMEEDERELNEFGLEPGAGMVGAPAPILERPFAPIQPNVPSPTPVQGFRALTTSRWWTRSTSSSRRIWAAPSARPRSCRRTTTTTGSSTKPRARC